MTRALRLTPALALFAAAAAAAASTAGCGAVDRTPNVRPGDANLARGTVATLIQQPPGLVAIVRCVSVRHRSEGTRSEQTRIRATVVEVVRGDARGTIDLWHWGAPRMDEGRTYVIAATGPPDASVIESFPIRTRDTGAVLARLHAQLR